MTIRWMLAHGEDGDEEVGPPETWDEIVILNYEQSPGGEDGFDETTIVFARAGADDLLGLEVVERAAVRLFTKHSSLNRRWAELPVETKRYYIERVQTVLAAVMELRQEKRSE